MSGAVLGSKDSYDVKGEAGTEASTTDSIADGTFVTVTDVSGTHVQVEYRKGNSMTTGWINAALFSPQPRLAKDDDNKQLPKT